ncbi:MAG: hypothetical protein ACK5Q5_08025 [Planctomycetaceae bacterium]
MMRKIMGLAVVLALVVLATNSADARRRGRCGGGGYISCCHVATCAAPCGQGGCGSCAAPCGGACGGGCGSCAAPCGGACGAGCAPTCCAPSHCGTCAAPCGGCSSCN